MKDPGPNPAETTTHDEFSSFCNQLLGNRALVPEIKEVMELTWNAAVFQTVFSIIFGGAEWDHKKEDTFKLIRDRYKETGDHCLKWMKANMESGAESLNN